MPAWSGNRIRPRLSRTGNRQLNCALHRIAVTLKRCCPTAQVYLQRRTTLGDTPAEALRVLKRRLSDIVYQMLLADSTTTANDFPRRANGSGQAVGDSPSPRTDLDDAEALPG